MTQRADWKQAEMTRAIKAALAAGLPLGSFTVEVENGKVRLLTGVAAQPQPLLSELEKWELEHGHRAA